MYFTAQQQLQHSSTADSSPGLACGPCGVGLGVGWAGVAGVKASLGLELAGGAVLACSVRSIGKGACTAGGNRSKESVTRGGTHSTSMQASNEHKHVSRKQVRQAQLCAHLRGTWCTGRRQWRRPQRSCHWGTQRRTGMQRLQHTWQAKTNNRSKSNNMSGSSRPAAAAAGSRQQQQVSAHLRTLRRRTGCRSQLQSRPQWGRTCKLTGQSHRHRFRACIVDCGEHC
jgi:hypothetical protein